MEAGEENAKKNAPLRTIINVLDIFIDAVRHPSVEPIIFLVYIGWTFSSTLQSPAFYRRVCETYYDGTNTSCSPITDPTVEDEVQKHNAEWSLYTSLAYLIPAVFADTIIGAYCDRRDRKVVIMLGIVGITISEFGFLLLFSELVHTPLWSTILFGVFAGCTGFVAMIPVSCNAYLADITEENDTLMIRSGIFTIAQLLASVIGTVVAAAVNWLPVTIAIDVELGLFAIAIIYVLRRIPRKAESEDRAPTLSKKKGFLSELKQLLKEGAYSYVKKRPGHQRAFIFATVIALMITNMTSVETRISVVMNSYVFRRTDKGSLQWDQEDLGYWNGSGYLIVIAGTLIGMYLFKQVLHCRQTTVILIAIASTTIRTLVIALASERWHMYVANACGLFAGLIHPAVVSFMAQLVSTEEIGRIFTLFAISCDLMFIIANGVYSNVYRLTETWLPGFLFFFIAGVQVMVWLLMLWVHIKSIMEGVSDRRPQPPRDIRKAISMIGTENPATYESEETEPKTAPKKKMSIYDHALERVAEIQKRNSRIDENWWGSYQKPAKYPQGSFY
ncbi:Proton-coupled folate transporter [Toxocara canis]|uniref:Proton-coupled folate transporter n=1 Tax=Toxocara canis TaxID=6265 RepID=A0A0B2UY38_TOXCA|nr:Proton-coupled folate transporter [Toxocara canis]